MWWCAIDYQGGTSQLCKPGKVTESQKERHNNNGKFKLPNILLEKQLCQEEEDLEITLYLADCFMFQKAKEETRFS